MARLKSGGFVYQLKRVLSRALNICLIGSALAVAANASVLFFALPNQSGGSDLNGFVQADTFTFANPVQVQQVDFWALQSVPGDYAGTIEWSFNYDSAGAPGASLASGLAAATGATTGNNVAGFDEYAYQFSVNVPMGPGVYWLLLHNGPSSSIPTTDFFWEWSNAVSGNSVSQDLSLPNQPWLQNFAAMAFELEGQSAAPEPGSIFLVGGALLAAVGLRVRKSN
jgi:hypothetical protein